MQDSLYKSYSFIMKNLRFDASISEFIKKIHLSDRNHKKILDVGCGTGVIGLTLAKRYSESSVLFTDINKKSLHDVRDNAEKKDILSKRLSFGQSDITTPKKITMLDNKELDLSDFKFDIVSTGAAIGYSKNQEETIKELLSLVKENGYFINVEMNQYFFGKAVSKKYQYPIMPLSNMEEIINSSGFKLIPTLVNTFPARLTRTCYIAHKL